MATDGFPSITFGLSGINFRKTSNDSLLSAIRSSVMLIETT